MNQNNENWISKYIELMRAGNFEIGLPLKMQNFPKSCFKYRPLNDYTLESLESNYVWLAHLDSLNHPYECSILFDNNEFSRHSFLRIDFPSHFKSEFGYEISQNEIDEITKSKEPYKTYTQICKQKGIVLHISPEIQLQRAQETWKGITERGRNNIKICSFSERNDSILMWSHYADQHKGICIEYDFEFDDNVRAFLQPVFYTNKLYKQKGIDEPFAINQIMASITKAEDWKYEQEWRLTIFAPLGKEIESRHKVSRPKSIYLGSRFDLNNSILITHLEELSRNQNIPLIRMSIHSSEYKIIQMN